MKNSIECKEPFHAFKVSRLSTVISYPSICFSGKMCDPYLPIGNSMSIFQLNGLNCTSDGQGTQASYQNQYDPHYDSQTNSCIGYMNVPVKINCSAVPPSNTTVRVCRCIDKGKTSGSIRDSLYTMVILIYWAKCMI